MNKCEKPMMQKDTIKSSIQCHFRKQKDDSLFSSLVYCRNYWKDEFTGEVIYTGHELVTTNARDCTATIMSASKWTKEIRSASQNYSFYRPLVSRKSKPMPKDSDLSDTTLNFLFAGEEMVNNQRCFHITLTEFPENDNSQLIKVLQIKSDYWINIADYVPVQYSETWENVMNNDTVIQYEINSLKEYKLNNLEDNSLFSLASIPDSYRTKDYMPYQSPLPLPKDTIAPGWELISLEDQKISLAALKGRLVLIDFFYKSCYPCMQALPVLQSLHDKYQDKGLNVVGIDPYDAKEDIATFLAKRGITYTVLLGGKNAAKDYRVSGYPTMYLLDKEGKILFVQEGYGKTIEKALEEIILKNL